MLTKCLIFCCCIAVSQTLFFGGGPEWNGLRVSWNPNPLSNYAFTAMPRTISDAMTAGFVLKDDFCGENVLFRGIRYWIRGDPTLILVYDIQGFIAGVQQSIPKSLFTPSSETRGHPYIEEADHFTLAAYFVDPKIICTTGRSQAEFDTLGTGDRLLLQTGSQPETDLLSVPNAQADVVGTKWVESGCFPTMGKHYFYNVSLAMRCEEFFPIFIMYNSGRLTALAFVFNAELNLSSRFDSICPQEGPAFGKFVLSPGPACFSNNQAYQKIMTTHVYMIDSPRTTSFC